MLTTSFSSPQGVFSITTLNIDYRDWRFAVTMVAVCVPFFFLIFVLQTRVGIDTAKKAGQLLNKKVRPWIFGTTAVANRAGGSGGAEAGGGKNKKSRVFAVGRGQRPGIRRTQSSHGSGLGGHAVNVHRRGTGTASLGGERGGVGWGRMRGRMRWGRCWRKRERGEEGGSTENDSNV